MLLKILFIQYDIKLYHECLNIRFFLRIFIIKYNNIATKNLSHFRNILLGVKSNKYMNVSNILLMVIYIVLYTC